MSQYSKENLLVLPEAGETTGTHLVIKIRSSELGGDFSVMEGVMVPHSLLTPHSHVHEDQAVIVLTGELEFEIGGDDGERFCAPAGSYVKKPRGVQHCFWNRTDEPVRYVELSGRDGFEGFVDSTTREGTIQGVSKAHQDYDMTWYFDRVPKLMIEHRLTRIAGLETPWEQLKEAGSPGDIIDAVRRAVTGAGC